MALYVIHAKQRLMTETDTTKTTPTHVVIKTLSQEKSQLDADDKVFYDFLKYRMDALLRKPREESIHKILAYSNNQRTR